jgi:HEPN domain-containing protein
MKGLLIALRVRFPYTHDLAELLSLIAQTGQAIPEQILEAAKLSDYAVEARYPGLAEPVIHEEYLEAINIAEAVVNWAEKIVG